MSKMGQLAMEIEDMIYQGHTAEFISKALNVPVDWVVATEDTILQNLELEKQYEAMSREREVYNG